MSESTGPAHRVKGGTLPPVVLLSAAYVAGIILASQTMIGPVVLVGTLASICAGAAAWTKSTGRTPYLLWCIVGLAAAGSLVFSIETHRLEQGFLLTVSRGQPEVEVVGRILGVPGKSRSGYSFPLAVSQVFKGGRRVVVSDRTWVNSDGREQELTVGQELRLRGRLSPVVFERGEGGFGQYLRRHGSRTTLSTDSKVFELR
ncbi:MAG: ComEC/Rec2 family competence protein, partial [Terriglobia bacterium]